MMADQPDDDWAGDSRRAGKSAEAFRTISEVSTVLEVPQHVLRFWETKFVQVRPLKRAGGRRYYRPEDVSLLRSIRDLLYRDGYTIKGAQKLLREGGLRHHPSLRPDSAGSANRRMPREPAGSPLLTHPPAAAPASGRAAGTAPAPALRATTPATAAGLEPLAEGEEEFAVSRGEIEALIDELTSLRDTLRQKLR
jgi:DNA-binding transcriptional MerR regulator